MQNRATKQAVEHEQAQAEYIQSVASSGSSADELEKLKSLHDQGVLTDAEFEAQKQKPWTGRSADGRLIGGRTDIGPLQLIVIGFVDPKLEGGVLDALADASTEGTIKGSTRSVYATTRTATSWPPKRPISLRKRR